jgi:hypothetical protein
LLSILFDDVVVSSGASLDMYKELVSVVVEVEVAFVVDVEVVVVVGTVVVDEVLNTVVVGGGVIPIPQIFPLQPHSPFDVFIAVVAACLNIDSCVVDLFEVGWVVVVLLDRVVDAVVCGFFVEIFAFLVFVKDTRPSFERVQYWSIFNYFRRLIT